MTDWNANKAPKGEKAELIEESCVSTKSGKKFKGLATALAPVNHRQSVVFA
jgi:hypothetical protein